jgi:hypothetical protein
MGTDVHAVWQAKKGGKWAEVESKWEQDRHYLLFSWLANVRNGFGFAGVPTYDAIKPIAMPRGYPSDFKVEDDMLAVANVYAIDPRRREWLEPDEAPAIWLGDHSHSWLTADEILAADRPGPVQRTGVVPIDWYRQWDGKTPPKEWSGSIAGRDIRVATAPSKIAPDTTHVQIEWDSPDDLDYFVDEVKRMKEEHGEVRLVFGFDS